MLHCFITTNFSQSCKFHPQYLEKKFIAQCFILVTFLLKKSPLNTSLVLLFKVTCRPLIMWLGLSIKLKFISPKNREFFRGRVGWGWPVWSTPQGTLERVGFIVRWGEGGEGTLACLVPNFATGCAGRGWQTLWDGRGGGGADHLRVEGRGGTLGQYWGVSPLTGLRFSTWQVQYQRVPNQTALESDRFDISLVRNQTGSESVLFQWAMKW